MTEIDETERTARRLHIGGEIRAPGWEVLNIVAGPQVDHVGDAVDLSRFEEASFEAVYASHVLEHLDYKDALTNALAEWHRVITPGGKLFVSVPDLAVLARLFLDTERLSLVDRWEVMRMIFGGHMDPHDYHLAGFDEAILGDFLAESGFMNIQRVDDFGLFQDTSCSEFSGVRISLNLTADKPA